MHKYEQAKRAEELLIHAIYEGRVESIIQRRSSRKHDILEEIKEQLNRPEAKMAPGDIVYKSIRRRIRLQENIDGRFQKIPKFVMLRHYINKGSLISFRVDDHGGAVTFIEIKFKGEK